MVKQDKKHNFQWKWRGINCHVHITKQIKISTWNQNRLNTRLTRSRWQLWRQESQSLLLLLSTRHGNMCQSTAKHSIILAAQSRHYHLPYTLSPATCYRILGSWHRLIEFNFQLIVSSASAKTVTKFLLAETLSNICILSSLVSFFL